MADEQFPIHRIHRIDLVGYQFRAEDLCPSCLLDKFLSLPGTPCQPSVDEADRDRELVEPLLNKVARCINLDREDERSFDSDSGGGFPKPLLREHCREARGWGDDATCCACGINLANVPAIPWRSGQ